MAYSLEEIFAEKIRSLFQRTRPRDLYDVWYLSKLGLDILDIVDEKLGFKGVSADLDGLLSRKEDFRNAWENSLRHQLKNLPDFNAVFDEVVKFLGGVTYEK